ncbi:hypothetical protein HJG60_010131 [Phyllostomus discolor]|uniref:Uncharacterized protein n=1 Tax=Phyllostomus discolor TaxID=89673 RepID=A0A834EJM6_9CHIR|nr:hypothetical protein HJG60_010131 [Phyllostomus discolor]
MPIQWQLLPPLTSIVKSSLFMCVHFSPLALVARLHRCQANHSHYINSGRTFSGQTSFVQFIYSVYGVYSGSSKINSSLIFSIIKWGYLSSVIMDLLKIFQYNSVMLNKMIFHRYKLSVVLASHKSVKFLYLKSFTDCNLAGVAQWIEHQPVSQGVPGLISSQGTCLGYGPGPQ